MNSPNQPDLFGDMPAQEPEALKANQRENPRLPGSVILIAQNGPGLNAQQRAFNKLSLDIEAERARLLEWQSYRLSFSETMAQRMEPAQAKLRACNRKFVILADQAVIDSQAKGAKRLSKKRKTILQDIIVTLIEGMEPAEGELENAELDAIYERHTGVSAEERREFEMANVEDFLVEEFGLDMRQGEKPESIDELLRQAREKIDQAEQQKANNRESRRAERHEKTGKISPAAEQKAKAARDMKQTVREIYRKLASDLHPDREADPAERARKTELMQRINAAYESNNLLDLLNLQMEVAQISEFMLAAISSERLKNFIKVLQEQLKTLKGEVRDIAQGFAAMFDLWPSDVPKNIRAAQEIVEDEIADVLKDIEMVEYDCAMIVIPAQRDQCIDRLDILGGGF